MMSQRSRATFLLLLVMTLAAACTGALGVGGVTPSATTTTAIIGWESRLRLEWTTTARPGGNDIDGYVYSHHGTPVMNVRLLAQGLDASGNVVGQTLSWVPGTVPGLQRAYFRIPEMPRAERYQVTVWAFNIVESKSLP